MDRRHKQATSSIDRGAVFEAIIFDLDGTLIQFRFDPLQAKREIINEVRWFGLDVSDLSEKEYTQNIVDKASEKLRRVGREQEIVKLKERIQRILEKQETMAFRNSKIFPMTRRVLSSLTSHRIKLALATNAGRKPVNEFVSANGLRHYFATIVTREDAERLKPYGDMLRKAVETLNVHQKRCLYVGDSVIDIMAARNAGIKVAAVSSGSSTRERLADLDPDFLLTDLNGLSSIVFPRRSSLRSQPRSVG